jgi:hypothetical protein
MYLGNPDVAAQTTWSLLDDKDPGAGVQLKYTGGQHCSSGARRALAIKFKCAKSGLENIEQQVIDESKHCQYDITIESEYACPTECGFGSATSMCANHGICRYDTDAKRARCFCNRGWRGAGCDEEGSEESAPTYGPVLGLLIFVTVVVVVLIGAMVFFWRYMHQRTMNTVQGEDVQGMQNSFGGSLMENNASIGGALDVGSRASGL